MIKENKKTPEIRFPGFTEDWEQRKLDDICNRYDNLRVPKKKEDFCFLKDKQSIRGCSFYKIQSFLNQ